MCGVFEGAAYQVQENSFFAYRQGGQFMLDEPYAGTGVAKNARGTLIVLGFFCVCQVAIDWYIPAGLFFSLKVGGRVTFVRGVP